MSRHVRTRATPEAARVRVPTRAWNPSWREVVAASGVGAAGQALFVVLAGSGDAGAFGAIVGGIGAWGFLRSRGVRARYLILAIIGAVAASVGMWEVCSTLGIARWTSVFDACLCPLVGLALGQLDRHSAHDSRGKANLSA